MTAQDVLNKAQGRMAPRVQRALEGVAGTSEAVREEKVREERGGETVTQLNPALRGISQKLLEKVHTYIVCILLTCFKKPTDISIVCTSI